jgi:hypothetical protein
MKPKSILPASRCSADGRVDVRRHGLIVFRGRPYVSVIVPCVESKPSQLVGMDEALKATEKNGFSIIDVTPDKLTFTSSCGARRSQPRRSTR